MKDRNKKGNENEGIQALSRVSEFSSYPRIMLFLSLRSRPQCGVRLLVLRSLPRSWRSLGIPPGPLPFSSQIYWPGLFSRRTVRTLYPEFSPESWPYRITGTLARMWWRFRAARLVTARFRDCLARSCESWKSNQPAMHQERRLSQSGRAGAVLARLETVTLRSLRVSISFTHISQLTAK